MKAVNYSSCMSTSQEGQPCSIACRDVSAFEQGSLWYQQCQWCQWSDLWYVHLVRTFCHPEIVIARANYEPIGWLGKFPSCLSPNTRVCSTTFNHKLIKVKLHALQWSLSKGIKLAIIVISHWLDVDFDYCMLRLLHLWCHTVTILRRSFCIVRSVLNQCMPSTVRLLLSLR